jgi:protein gp37
VSEQSAIEWTDATWNPTTGCTKISPGCAHCYIASTTPFRMHGRTFVDGHIPLQFHTGRIGQPLLWKKPRRIFVNSLSDLFHDDVPDEVLHQVYYTMEAAHWHTFQVLTKRPARMRAYLAWRYGPDADTPRGRIPSRHIWHGVSVENQHFADERIPLLLQTPSAVRFISAEPLLGPVDLTDVGDCINALDDTDAPHGTPFLDWVIVGGESGPKARPFDLAWARSILSQCDIFNVPCFVKQLGARPIFPDGGGWEWPQHDRKGGDMAEWPADLRVREFPDGRIGHPAGAAVAGKGAVL